MCSTSAILDYVYAAVRIQLKHSKAIVVQYMLQLSTSLLLRRLVSGYFSHILLTWKLPVKHEKLPSPPEMLPVSLLAVIRLLDGSIGRLRVNRVPGWIIRCPLVPDRHSTVTHYAGTSFGVRAGLQRICRTSLIDNNADRCNTQHTASSSKTDLSLSHSPRVVFF